MLNTILNSGFRILGNQESVEVDRITSYEKDNLIFQLRVRNNSRKPAKIYSFVVSEFYIPDEIKITGVLENNWLQCSDILYKDVGNYTVKRKSFLQRDQNPYSFTEEYGYLEKSVVSEWFTSINVGKNKSLFIGAVTTKDQFSQVYIRKEGKGVFVRVTCQNDGLVLNPGQVIKSEKIFFGVGDQNLIKNQFATSLAKHMKVKKVPKPIKAMCNSYYWNTNKIDESIINRELDVIESLRSRLNLDYFQLDAGYTKYFGDWLDYKERFPQGFKNIVDRINKLGFKPGIWLSPFSINPGTKLHDHHKSWLLKDQHKKHFEGRWTSPFDNISNMVDLEVLDPTKTEVKEYLSGVLTHFKNLGFKLFKLDFLYPVCLAGKFSKPVTRAQALREGLEFIRGVLGDDCLILTGITQLSSVVGIADHVRTGIDSLNPFVNSLPLVNNLVNEYMFDSNLKESELRGFLNGIVWRADPDVLVFSSYTGIDPKAIEKQKKFVKANRMSMWIGDSIAQMSDDQKRKVINYFNN